jgi:hypothetical protein
VQEATGFAGGDQAVEEVGARQLLGHAAGFGLEVLELACVDAHV